MCGIAGLTGRRAPEVLGAMLDAIGHRGPDDEGQEWVEATPGGWLGLGNRRLSILDLSSAGHQPMGAGESRLAYNGEVYNFLDLRRELEQEGHRFRSGSDTEVVLQLLRRYGARGLSRLNGMFALAFWDADRRELLLARDRFGIKPLYYSWRAGRLVFASEAKCLLAAGVPACLGVEQLGSYLSFGWVPGPRTLFEDIVELPPGGLLRWGWGSHGLSVETYRPPPPEPEPEMDGRAAAAELRERLAEAVRRQVHADVPVGVLLSGGLDSSAIAGLAATSGDRPVRAYSIAIGEEDSRLEQSSDDARCARLAARRLGLDLREFEVSPDVTSLLETVAWHLDDPVADPAAILTLLISRAAAPEVKVLLSGQGSDELFGGYRVHLYERLAGPLSRSPRWLRRAAGRCVEGLPAVARHLPVGRPGLLLAGHRACRTVLDNDAPSPELRYIGFRSAYHFQGDLLTRVLDSDVRCQALARDPTAFHLQAFHRRVDLGFFDRMLDVDLQTFLPSQNLAYSDRMSMAASVEMRVPFLDDDVADLALRIPARLKVRGLRGKQVLRAAMAGVVPDEIIHRRKAGFGAPIRGWLRGELAPLLSDTLSDRWLDDTRLFDKRVVRTLVDDHVSGRRDHTYRIWTLLSFALWHRAHLGQPARRSPARSEAGFLPSR